MSWIKRLFLEYPNIPRRQTGEHGAVIPCPWHDESGTKSLQLSLHERKKMFTCMECGIFGHKQFLYEKLAEDPPKKPRGRPKIKPYNYLRAPLKPLKKPDFVKPPQGKPKNLKAMIHQNRHGEVKVDGVFKHTNQKSL